MGYGPEQDAFGLQPARPYKAGPRRSRTPTRRPRGSESPRSDPAMSTNPAAEGSGRGDVAPAVPGVAITGATVMAIASASAPAPVPGSPTIGWRTPAVIVVF